MVRQKEIESILNYIGKSSLYAADVTGLCLCLWYSIMLVSVKFVFTAYLEK
jgi:hypothetical protein